MKRSTWIVLVIFLALAGLLLYLNQKEPVTEEGADVIPTAPVEYLFTEIDGLPTSIDIMSKTGEHVVIARNQAGEWVLKQPIEAEANQGPAEAAASQLTTLRIMSRPEVATDEVGLVPSSYIMTVELTSGMVKTVRIGDVTPTESGYYTNVNESNKVLIIGKTGLDSLLTLVSSPPYVSTPTPAP